jgi:UPF0288 family protein (methanogenesis marker protein 3)
MTRTLTNAKVRDLLVAHNALDGWIKAVEVNGQTTTVREPYILTSKTKCNNTKNLSILRDLVEKLNKEMDEYLTRLSDGTNEINSEKEPEKAREYAKMVAEIESTEVEVKGLLVLKMADLLNDPDFDKEEATEENKKKKVNPIQQTVLASLEPVLDVFQSKTE